LPGLLGDQDVIAFTGSSGTARRLRSLEGVQSGAVRLNVEADSLNAAVLGPDVDDDSDTYELFLSQVSREMTQKAGQKCTAIRRILVPRERREQVRDALIDRLGGIVVGNPAADGVRMGPVATAQQQRDVRAGIEQLRSVASVALGDGELEPRGVDAGKGYFVPITLLETDDPDGAEPVHDIEVFGPVATLLGCDSDPEHLGALLARGKGGLVSSIYSDDRAFCGAMLASAGAHHGRLCFGSRKIAGQAPSPGMVLPGLVHGGPGRAGGGEELGGLRGLGLYSQRLAVQGARPMLDAMLGKG
jgi:oxepin-CoA hydrolase/3-oxo-5,6-dehydrosuberyl-CoA semialdehyde dehydrogenase